MLKKIFGGINLTWTKVIILAVIMGIYTAIMAMLPIARDTSFSDLTVTFEVWILFGVFIIMNSKSPLDSALKCFIFFLISQPLVYLIQDFINHSMLFKTYYRYWFMWTIACLPMGFIGYYIKKDKWWGIIILCPILLLLSNEYSTYMSKTMFSFPRHLLSMIFSLLTLIIYPIGIFRNKFAKISGIVISVILIMIVTVLCIQNPPIYSTDILSDSSIKFDDAYKVYLEDRKYGDLSIRYEEAIEAYMIHAEFKKAGKTKFVLESPSGEKKEYGISIRRDKYTVKKIK